MNKSVFFKTTCWLLFITMAPWPCLAQEHIDPEEINFTRQAVRRYIFDDNHTIPLAVFRPAEVIGITAMHPARHYLEDTAALSIAKEQLLIESPFTSTQTAVWVGGFNPFATYTLDIKDSEGDGAVGFEFEDADDHKRFAVSVAYREGKVTDVRLKISGEGIVDFNESIATAIPLETSVKGKIILQLLGSGLTVYVHNNGLPHPIGQSDFSHLLDLRAKRYLRTFQSRLLVQIEKGLVSVGGANVALSSGMGLADIRAMTYEDGTPLLDKGRLWYTMTIRGRALPHHIQGVFSMNPTVFDLRFEGIIVFDRADGLLRNEVASHIFYDRKADLWRGITTGFSAYADSRESKQLLAVESRKDPRFGFSVMEAEPFGLVGDIEDPHILYDSIAGKWRILTCENTGGYKAVLLESDFWNKNYQRIAGPVKHNSTGTSIQRIGGVPYCFSGSSEREVFIYSYPDLKEIGTLKMDLPPWDEHSGTRVWPNVVELPLGYPYRYVALMMDRLNYPGLVGPNWTYGALYLYYGYLESADSF